MDQFVNGAYDFTSQLLGPGSGIPWWAWVFVLVALMWKFLLPERRTARDRDTALVASMAGGKSGKKTEKKKK